MATTELVGSWGWWQVRLAALLALPMLLSGMYGTNYVFLAAHTPHRCHVPECENSSALESAPAPESWRPDWAEFALPDDACRRRVGSGACRIDAFYNETQECDAFVYQHHSSIKAEFDLGCQEWKRTLVGTIHNVGMLVSLPLIGYISDRWGRRTALVVAGVGAGVWGLLKSLAPAYTFYLAAEFLETVFGASVYPAGFVLMIEWLSVDQRILASLVLGVPLAAGAALLALLDHLAGYWRLWARIAYPPSFLLLLYLWLLPESVRWLLTQERVDDALHVIKRAARVNRMMLSDDSLQKIVVNENPEKIDSEDESLLSAFKKYGALRRRLAVCGWWWLGGVLVFYGLAVRAHSLAGSPHANYALVAAAELPALVLNTLLLDRVGRRPLLTAAWLLTAASLATIPYVPQAATALFLLGKVGATMALNGLYVYTAELFPTRARQRLLACCSAVGRVGAILAPQVPLLAAYGEWVPTTLLATLPLLSAALARLMPETLGRTLPDTFADLAPPPAAV
ncbi:solute carrier family 22 member 13-like [Aricia agestis]|uniref:solute carrier family 22 member 13-like n=1 Tax=Aricia agestis TaxID=91739 RepID=UPI001C202BCC|nr:solute carrier family 22 member 13-like [Aricia agestis]